jgi:hypothetical protein
MFVCILWLDPRKIYKEKKEKSNFVNLLLWKYPNPCAEEVFERVVDFFLDLIKNCK